MTILFSEVCDICLNMYIFYGKSWHQNTQKFHKKRWLWCECRVFRQPGINLLQKDLEKVPNYTTLHTLYMQEQSCISDIILCKKTCIYSMVFFSRLSHKKQTEQIHYRYVTYETRNVFEKEHGMLMFIIAPTVVAPVLKQKILATTLKMIKVFKNV